MYHSNLYFLKTFFQPPAYTFGDPVATLVHPAIASPTLPQPFPLIKTVPLPTAIGAEWEGHGTPGSK